MVHRLSANIFQNDFKIYIVPYLRPPSCQQINQYRQQYPYLIIILDNDQKMVENSWIRRERQWRFLTLLKLLLYIPLKEN